MEQYRRKQRTRTTAAFGITLTRQCATAGRSGLNVGRVQLVCLTGSFAYY
jgi:hypothetical protein